jgi:ABC-type Na+ transport system ATPase subunit NatA
MLTLTHVTKRFPGGVTAVNDVSLDLKAGVGTYALGSARKARAARAAT